MLKMTEKTKAFLIKWLPDVNRDTDDVNSILEPLYDLIMYQGFDENWAYNDFGHEAQEVYDDLYWSNHVED